MCEVCLLVPRDGVALVPCGHARFCSACANTVTEMGNGCPLCRTPIDMVFRVFCWDCNVFNVLNWICGGTVRVFADFKGTLGTTATSDNINVTKRCIANFLVFFQCKWSRIFRSCIYHPAFSVLQLPVLHFPGPHFPVMHFSTLEIWSLIFQWCRSLFDLSGPSLVSHFPVLHFQSTPLNHIIRKIWID